MKFEIGSLAETSEMQESLKESLRDGGYPWYDQVGDRFQINPETVLNRSQNYEFPQWLKKLWSWLPEWNMSGYGTLPSNWGELLVWTLFSVLLLALVIVLILAYIDVRKTPGRAQKSVTKSHFHFEISDEILESSLTHSQIWERALDCKRQGQLERAVSLAWLAMMKRFLEHHDVKFQKSLTPRQWAKMIESTCPALNMLQLVAFYEVVIYGKRQPVGEIVGRWWQRAEMAYSSINGEV